MDFEKLEKLIGYKFTNMDLCELAFRHSSYAYEQKLESNERLEFFGDSILNMIVTEYLVFSFTDKDEGVLSKIKAKAVSTETLADIVEENGFDEFLALGQSELKGAKVNRKKMHANLFESMLAAIFMDSDFETARNFVLKFIRKYIDVIENSDVLSDYKTALQEYVQSEKGSTLKYELLSKNGPDHSPIFCYQVKINDEVFGKGCGKSKSDAQIEASHAACEKLKTREDQN